MKKIILSICIIFSINSFSQDSSKIKVNITIQARDCEIVLFFTRTGGQKFEDLDSTMLTKFRPPAVAPTGTTNVTINGIENRVWLDMWRLCYEMQPVVIGGTADRIGTALKTSGQSWLANKVIKDEAEKNDIWVLLRKIGREYGKKETTGFE